MKTRYIVSCAVAAVLSGSAGGAFAAAADAAGAADASASATALEEVIVTAQRRDESAQTVPMTIQAFSGAALAARNITTFDDLLKITPNIEFAKNGPGQGNIFMRGLSAGFAGNQSSATVGNFPNVAVYLDEQSMQFPARNVDLYLADMERVEVLEGPQGTLFGGGAEAGALRYITNKPKLNVMEGKLDASYGVQTHGDPSSSFSATLNIPIITDKFAVRAVIYNDRQGGYIDNVPSTFTRSNQDNNAYFGITPTNGKCPNGQPPGSQTGFCTIPNAAQANNFAIARKAWNPVTHDGLRLSALYDVNDDWNVLITESFQNLDAEGLSTTLPVGSDFQPLKPLETTVFSPTYDKDRFQNTAWTVNGKVGDLKLIYTGGYMTRHINQQMDYTNYSRTLYGQYYECTGGNAGLLGKGALTCYSPVTSWHDVVRNTHLSQEIRLSTPDTWRLRGVGGVFYERFRIFDTMDFNYKTVPACREGDNLANALAGGAPCFGNVEPFPGSTTNEPGVRPDATGFGEQVQRGYDQTALFGSVDYDIIPDVLTVTAGTRYYRYTEDETGSVYSTNSKCVNVLVCGHNTNIDAENLHAKYTGFKSHFGAQWKPMENTLLYYTFSQGFRPGGFSRSARDKAPDANGVPQYKTPLAYTPDTLTNNEIGVKKEFFDRRLQLNLSAYYMQWDNVQIALYQPCCLGNTTFLVNGPSYTIKGAELQFAARITEQFTLQGSATYNDNTQSNSPCLTANEPNSPTLGKCITEIKGKPFVNPFGVQGGVSAFSPKFQGNLHGRYDWEIASFKAFASGDVSYTGKMFTQPANYTPGSAPSESPIPDTTYLRYELPAYTTFGAAVGVSRDAWTLQLVGSNLGNSHASTFTSTAQFIKAEVPLRPRQVSIRITEAF
ncbi:MAG TPA: TonB-dependent receptor [Phenylobacterium sp.]|jgi:iron complex outermembrane receptor protein|uniref:TonB-dependent receptor n=1 Tax=Phenylobacterium sp. TaxID=1871053 RepID=UPI002C54F926|nr:TonB-dependent receptor [Phenylobacterium sp.]HXA37387.1 TonB-dependent receptor [Phenylobacterium sp.]